MLNLKIKEGELLHIGDSITLIFERHQDPILAKAGIPSHSKQVKIGIDAPRHIKILRSELSHQ